MTRKKTKSKGKKLPVGQLQREILKIFKQNPRNRFNPKQISKRLESDNNKDSVLHALMKLTEAGHLSALEDFKFALKRSGQPFVPKKLYEGYVDMTRQGSAYIECEGLENDVYVSAKNLGPALHGDLVQIAVWPSRGRRKPEGEVLKVVERASERFVGTIYLRNKYALVVPSRDDMPVDILIELDDIKDAQEGDRVVVKVTEWHKNQNTRPKGVVTAVLGAEGSDLEMKIILINNGFNLEFPEEVLAESEDLPDAISLQEIHRRRDFRKITTFTIDPVDAKDFDDALSIEYLENGNFEIGVHIADVTHFVKSGSALDREGYKRSTSVYLVDRVLPMLPERISNNLCSLRPNEDRLTFSAVFEFDKNDKVVKRWFGKGIIHSDRRFAYEDAQQVLDAGKGDFIRELTAMNTLAKKLRKDRFKKGAIDFDMEEVRFKLDEKGVPVELFVKERLDAHMLIEEFMLLANREVATFIHKKGENLEIPFVYRVHDFPNEDKVAELARFAKELGFNMNISNPKEIGKSFNRLVKAAETDHALKLLQPIAIRTMAKAEYSPDNIGHYGLAFEYYSHFTSPIRRYSDVLSHRILEANLGDRTMRVDKNHLQEQCKHISLQERKAMDAERQSIKYKQVEFMEKHVGEEFEGYVSGIIERGIFVELKETKCEGMVGFETLNEPFEVEDGRLKAKGMRTGRMLKMGDTVKVRILDTNLSKRQIEMELL
ncbi:MAG: ribonuclease R [Lewinellaceae bacterium]|nr:ribonuclease R [Saprospiraceae bacterium]MCB9340169.1 ribonuclease R [Lewinellaceae bacterium]